MKRSVVACVLLMGCLLVGCKWFGAESKLSSNEDNVLFTIDGNSVVLNDSISDELKAKIRNGKYKFTWAGNNLSRNEFTKVCGNVLFKEGKMPDMKVDGFLWEEGKREQCGQFLKNNPALMNAALHVFPVNSYQPILSSNVVNIDVDGGGVTSDTHVTFVIARVSLDVDGSIVTLDFSLNKTSTFTAMEELANSRKENKSTTSTTATASKNKSKRESFFDYNVNEKTVKLTGGVVCCLVRDPNDYEIMKQGCYSNIHTGIKSTSPYFSGVSRIGYCVNGGCIPVDSIDDLGDFVPNRDSSYCQKQKGSCTTEPHMMIYLHSGYACDIAGVIQ